MNASITQTTTDTVESTYSMTGGLTITTSCPEPEDPTDNAIGYWIFVVDTNESTATAIAPIGVCRYDDGYWNVSPTCPFAACIDDQCRECSEWTDEV